MLLRAAGRPLLATLTTASRCKAIPSPRTLNPTPYLLTTPTPLRAASSSSSSSTRWKTRQSTDAYARSAKLSGLKSRAAFKLLEINDKHRLFRPGDTVVDLGFAPGSWSQVAVNRTSPGGRVVGIDVIPAQPPRGANALQGNFLSREIREEVRRFVGDVDRGRVRSGVFEGDEGSGFVELEKAAAKEENVEDVGGRDENEDTMMGRTVNVVLSDMSEPWPLVTSTWIKSVSNPHRRMLNTSGIAARDHGGSMVKTDSSWRYQDLCMAALTFAYDTLATGGHFLCKFYTGAEDHALELRLKKLFEKVHRIKPDATRKESKEAYFVALRRRAAIGREDVLGE
ncbi:hypothetical protein M409DRAFT_48946 [Zasmidium cellare ATCC 36951]|uniref:rRNA methyltransferase 2, mitochondrial n=1 Tax=Zasmidium cellare ATCC 36951 TaxID=1080233 RepID=A0A6A6D3S0_ZASCE|nr:uncharacterized protein M409DRAFT_48946 [Zasmidium cellare ATCC 36951]KAF2174061.1 hypothetical protein M409DRAFT_48946 [Zasmidium cellare ATCC 36951]